VSRVAVAVAMLAVPAVARAESARLDYVADAAGCPSEAELRASVAMRLGYDPFTVDAERTVEVRIHLVRERFEASVRMRDAAGETTGRRDLDDTGTCAELADVLVLAVSIAVDPSRALGVDPVPEPAPEPVPAPGTDDEPPPDPTPAPPSDVHTPWILSGALSIYSSAGFSPTPTGGARLEARAQSFLFSIGLAGFAEVPTETAVTTGRVLATRAGGEIAPCVHGELVSGCAVVQLGALWAEGRGVAVPRDGAAFFVALGGRLAVSWTVNGLFVLGAYADFLATPTPVEVELGGQRVWGSGYVGGALGVTIGVAGDVR
jgi:hypothetical protein